MDTRDQYLKEMVDLQKAVKALDAAINGLSVPTKITVQDVLPHFRAGINAMPKEMGVNLLTSPGQAMPSQKSIVKNCFVRDVATAYRKQTGNEPTIVVGRESGDNEGPFVEFLLACAGELKINPKGLASRAKKLRARGEI